MTLAPLVAALRTQMAHATPGPWHNGVPDGRNDAHMGMITAPLPEQGADWVSCHQVVARTWHPEYPVVYVGISRQQTVANAEFIVSLVNAAPDILEALERLEQIKAWIEHEIQCTPPSQAAVRLGLLRELKKLLTPPQPARPQETT